MSDSVVHLLDGLELGESKTSLVGDVVDSSLRLGVLSVDSTNLELESIADRLEVWLGRDLWKTDVDGGTDGGSQVGWAEGEPSETVVAGEWSLLLDGLDSLDETLQDLSDVSSLLHGDDTEMVLFVAPDEESLLVVVEDSTSLWPVAASVGGLEESVSLLEEEVVLDELVLDILGHSIEWEVLSSELWVGDVVENSLDLRLHLEVVGLSETWVEWVSLEGTSATDSGGVDVLSFWVEIDESSSLSLSEVGVWLLGIWSESVVVVLDQWVEEWLEESVSLSVWGVDSDS